MNDFSSSTGMPEKPLNTLYADPQRNQWLIKIAKFLLMRGDCIEQAQRFCHIFNSTKFASPFDGSEVDEIVLRAFTSTPLNAESNENDTHENTTTQLVPKYGKVDFPTVIAKAMGTTPAEPTGSTILIAEPLNMSTSASIDVENESVSPVSLAVKPQSTTIDEESAEDVVADYYFPTSTADDDLSDYEHADLMAKLELLIDMVKTPDDYMAIREQYCEISIALNERKLWAPAYRHGLIIPKMKANLKPVHTLVLRDRIVIDCHWIHSKGYKNRIDEKQWRPLSKLKMPFPFELAVEFARREMRTEYRAEGVMSLTIRQQFEMRALQGKTVQAHVYALKQYQRIDGVRIPNSREIIRLAVNRWCEKYPRFESEREKYLAHAEARALLAIVTASPTDIANLAGMIQDINPLSEGTVRGLLKNMDKWLKELAP